MQTVVIFDSYGEAPIQFFVAEGDFRGLNEVYINAADSEEAAQDKLIGLLLQNKDKMLYTFPVEAVRQGAFVIVAGFLP